MLRRNARQLEKQINRCIDELWLEDGQLSHAVWALATSHLTNAPPTDNPLLDALQETLHRLRARWPDDLPWLAADMAFAPSEWAMRYLDSPTGMSARLRAIEGVLAAILHETPPPDIAARIEQRLADIVQNPYERSRNAFPPEHNAFWPGPTHLSQLLLALPPADDVLTLMERIVTGELATRMPAAQAGTPDAYQLVHRLDLSLLAARLYAHDRFDYSRFAQMADVSRFVLAQLSASILAWRTGSGPRYHRIEVLGADFLTTVEQWLPRLARERAADPTGDDLLLLRQLSTLSGPEWLLRAAAIYQNKMPLVKQPGSGYTKEAVEAAVRHLAGVSGATPSTQEEQMVLVEHLRVFQARTLRAVLPRARHAHGLVLAALGWGHAGALVAQIVETAQRGRAAASGYPGSDVPNSSDPASGTLDVAAFRTAIDAAGEDLTREIFKLFRQAKVDVSMTIYLAEALLGWNREKVEKGFAKRSQPSVKAYGLLPLSGPDEALARYRAIRAFERGATKYGPQRQASERGAAQAALNNLAQVAGYPDVTRMEWDMEARLATEVVPAGRTWTVGDYCITLQLEADSARLVVERGGKTLKSVPKAVRESDDYPVMREAVEGLRLQVRRFRQVFEDLMARAAPLSRDDLENLNRMPAAAALLSRLVLLADSETLGLYVPDALAVETPGGERVPIREEATIAHPYHLYQHGQLPGWQRAVIRRRIVQPFKQAFRELYVLTPAEQETGTYSNRFAGHLVDGGTATKLFQARGWEIESGDVPVPHRVYRAEGLEARFELADAFHYLGHSPVTTDRIVFRPYPAPRSVFHGRDAGLLPLADVSPTLFSEVMRDADLIVSVAQAGGGRSLSEEAYQRRGELVTALLEELGLPGVTVEGHFARVEGKLARYRVHLGSAAIHIEPGSYLCIVPQRWGQTHKKLFLPFADDGDRKVSEVISKILLLQQDDCIKDSSIVAQIKRQTARR